MAACGVCRTDLHVVDGELPHPQMPIIPGHEIVGRIDAIGGGVEDLRIGERVGIPWLGHTCGICPYCMMQRENLCDHPLFTGYTRDGGYRDRDDRRCALCVSARRGRQRRGARAAALCRADRLALAGDRGRRQEDRLLRLWRRRPYPGAGGEVAGALGVCVHAAGRCGDPGLCPSLGAVWAGGSDEMPPEPLDAAIIFATVGDLVPAGAARRCAKAVGWFAPAST